MILSDGLDVSYITKQVPIFYDIIGIKEIYLFYY